MNNLWNLELFISSGLFEDPLRHHLLVLAFYCFRLNSFLMSDIHLLSGGVVSKQILMIYVIINLKENIFMNASLRHFF